jgi:hypothetical protein
MIPVIIIHLHDSPYLPFIINRAIKSNNYIYFISNIKPAIEHSNLTFIDIKSLNSKENQYFSSIYAHLHPGPKDYELFCFQRWFMLHEFLNQHKISTAFHIDSDVLLYADMNAEWLKYNQYTMTVAHGCSGATSFITQVGLDHFTKMLIDIYDDKGFYFNNLVNKYKTIQQFNMSGGICDMTLLELFKNNHDFGGGFGRVGEMMQIIDNSTYDHNINTTDSDYAMRHGIKKIEIINDGIYVYNERIQKHIRFNALHCQGQSKKYINTIYDSTQHL